MQTVYGFVRRVSLVQAEVDFWDAVMTSIVIFSIVSLVGKRPSSSRSSSAC